MADERLRAIALRRALERERAPWRLLNDVDDDARPPELPLGGEVPADALSGDAAEPTDFAALLAEAPPADPDLAWFCIDAGLLDEESAPSAQRRRRGTNALEAPQAGDEGSPSLDLAGPDDVAPPALGQREQRDEGA